MAMAKKDYVAIAGAVANQRPTIDTWETDRMERALHDARHETIDEVAEGLASVFAGDNPRFDRARFLAACKGDITP